MAVIALEVETVPAKNPRINVVMPSELKPDFERLCELEERSQSNMLVYLARLAVEEAKRDGRLSDRAKGDKT